MAHEIDKERLSAFLDGELEAPAKAELLAHLPSCPDCSAYLEKIKHASSDFKKHGEEKVPAAVLASALAQAKGKRAPDAHPFHKLIIAFTVAILVIVAGGILARKFAPGFFGQIQGMISGAAGNLGQ